MAGGVRDSGGITITVCHLCGSLEDLMLCKGCRCAWYCSKEHQTSDWNDHKVFCRGKRSQTTDNLTNLSSGRSYSKTKFVTNRNALGAGVSDISGGRDKKGDPSVKTFPGKQYFPCLPEGIHVRKQDNRQTLVPSCHNFQEGTGAASATYLQSAVTGHSNSLLLPTEGSVESYILESDATALNPSPAIPGRTSMPPYNIVDPKQTYLSVLESRNKLFGDYVVNCLNKFGVCVIDDFLGETKGMEIFQEVKNLQKSGVFKKGQLVNTGSGMGMSPSNSTTAIRGDLIYWVDGTEVQCKNVKFLVSMMDAVILHCAGKLGGYNINGRTKAMAACYPGNSAGYVRHVDNPNGDGRCVTCIYYLNKEWNAESDGGLLQIFPENEDRMASVEPKFDRLLFFWSDRRNPHEVQPTFRTRYAITIWYYDAEERARAIKRFKSEKGSLKRTTVPLFNRKEPTT